MSRLSSALLQHAAAALGEVLRFDHPADAVLSRYFREHHQLGHADRGFVAESVFAVLRRRRTLEYLAGPGSSPRRLLLAGLACVRGFSVRDLEPLLRGDEAEWLPRAKGADLDALPPAIRLDLPDWLYEWLAAQFDVDELATLAAALNQPAPLDLRVNPLRADRDAVIARLAADGIAGAASPFSPLGIRLAGKPALSKHPLFVDGSIEVQDEGSQLLGFLLAPRRGEMVVDFCAGAGGKTLLLGGLMRSQGRLYAFDVSEKRLANLRPRLARSGLSNVHPVRIETENDLKVKRLAGKADRVLVDAPCSGLGTLRRNPDLKWRQTPAAVDELVAKQKAILAAAARLVKPGGRLVYATCSLLDAENGQVVAGFLADHPDFAPLSAEAELAKAGIVLPCGEQLRLLPHRHETDGFFAALLERRR